MRSHKGSRRIAVGGAEYRWRATGNDGYISIGIWPTNNIGPFIQGNFCYHETWIDNGDGSWSSAGNQIVITNRILRRIIEYAKGAYGYDPQVRGKELKKKVAVRPGWRADTADGESAVPELTRVLGERLHAIVKASAPDLAPRLWYGMPAYAKDGKVVCFFQLVKKAVN